MRAARYLGVAPWELARQPSWWLDAALLAEQAEAKLANAHAKLQAGG